MFEGGDIINNVFRGKVQSPAARIAVAAVMAALVCVSTLMFRIPVPATGGYINIGDVMIFVSGLAFGKTIGGFAGGVGSAIADLIGYPSYAPLTLVVKGIEGALVGVISDGTSKTRDVLAVIVGGGAMIAGYYLGEAFIMGVGPYAALVEVPGNFFQVLAGGVIGVPISWVIQRYLTTPRWR
ncbi:MAG: ECF transporter S component [Candidatus Bathyarchaeota archaeon]|nr:ECF transporter S component [Candidatus Bathyarchaeota archaeon]